MEVISDLGFASLKNIHSQAPQWIMQINPATSYITISIVFDKQTHKYFL